MPFSFLAKMPDQRRVLGTPWHIHSPQIYKNTDPDFGLKESLSTQYLCFQ